MIIRSHLPKAACYPDLTLRLADKRHVAHVAIHTAGLIHHCRGTTVSTRHVCHFLLQVVA